MAQMVPDPGVDSTPPDVRTPSGPSVRSCGRTRRRAGHDRDTPLGPMVARPIGHEPPRGPAGAPPLSGHDSGPGALTLCGMSIDAAGDEARTSGSASLHTL